MFKMTHNLPAMAAAAFAFMFLAPMAQVQSSDLGCSLSKIAGAPGQVIRCRKGVTITVEAGARFRLLDRDNDGNADSVALRHKALLVDETTSAAGFQIVTPQAIVAVRGTKWAVDVQKNKTSVLVINGRVAVRRPAAKDSVLLGPGEGVDVEVVKGPLTVRRWPAARVSALLARFGQ